MTTILVTGASGQLGSELKELSVKYSGYDFVFTDVGELDITDAEATASFISEISPAWIINCAAYTAVDKAEEEEDLATKINGKGVESIVRAIEGSDCRLIHISTSIWKKQAGRREGSDEMASCHGDPHFMALFVIWQ
jgi:dTDP-4-dehydrorhamnose reductase